MLYIPYPFKRCTKCGNEYPRTAEFFHKDRSRPDGLNGRCKACHKADVAQWQREHSEQVAERKHEYYLKHSERIAGKAREYYRESKEKIREQHHEYYAAHKEQAAKQGREYRMAHKEQVKERIKKWITANPERYRKMRIDSAHRCYAANPDKERAKRHRRRAAGKISEQVIKAQYKRQKGRCYYCGVKVGDKYHLDHVTPLSRGGTNAAENLVIACPHCNDSKGGKLPHEWAKGGRLL